MRITLGQLKEMVSMVAGGPAEWEPVAEDVALIGYMDEDGEPVEDGGEPAYVIFTVQGPWSKGPLEVDASMSYLYTVAQGRDYGVTQPDHVHLWWTRPRARAKWDEIGTSIVSIAKAAKAAGILDV